jgi:hypothetical protein
MVTLRENGGKMVRENGKMVTLYESHCHYFLCGYNLRQRDQERLLLGGHPMPRIPRRRQWTDPACYHLMDRGHNRETVFHDDEDRASSSALSPVIKSGLPSCSIITA